MNRAFLDSGGKKNKHRKKSDTTATVSIRESDGTLNDATPLVDPIEKEVVSPSVVDETAVKEKQSPLVNSTGLGSPTQKTHSTGTAPDKSSYTNVTGKPIRKKLNFCTLFTPRDNGIDMVLSVKSIKAIRILGVNIGLFDLCLAHLHGYSPFNLGKSSYARAMIELRADVELRDNIVAAMPKITKEGYYTCNIYVEYEWKPPRCACCKVFGHTREECPKNIVYQPVSKKSTANTSVNKKNNVDPTKEVSKSNPFDVLTSVKNDVELGINEGTLNLASQTTNSSGSSFWNVDASSPSTTLVIDKIDKIEKLIIEGKVTLVDDDDRPLEKVSFSCDYDSEDEVASVDNDMAKFLAKKDGYSTQSFLKQWTKFYENGDYRYNPHDDDMYEGQDIPKQLQTICDNWILQLEAV
nr:hypothetical protein [Tanacetum cinerariifolium]